MRRQLLIITAALAILAVWARLASSAEPDLALLIAIKEAELRLATPPPIVTPPVPAGSKPAAPAPVASVPSMAGAQPNTWPAPVAGFLTEADLTADQQPTPLPMIGAALRLLQPRVGETFYDLGCGPDARACIVAARDCGLNAVGIEIDPAAAEEARRVVELNGLSHKIKIITADAADVDIPDGAIGYAYLWPDTLQKLAQKIARFRCFVSYAHQVHGLPWRKSGDLFVHGSDLFVRGRPTAQAVVKTFRQPVAFYGGKQYTRAKAGCNCAMCRSIRRQLQRQVTYKAVAAPMQASSGHWETRRVCQNGRCRMVRSWVSDR